MLMRVVLILVALYAAVAVLVFTAGDTSFDQGITVRLQHFGSPFLDGVMEFISWWASIPGGSMVILSMSLLFALRKRYVEIYFLFATLAVVPIVSVIKQLFGRARPTADLVRVARQFNHESFPSGHVVFYTVLFGFITYLMYRHWTLPNWLRYPIGTFCLFLISTVGISRMYLGAHWFTDVTAGFVLGLLLLIGLVVWYNRVIRHKKLEVRA